MHSTLISEVAICHKHWFKAWSGLWNKSAMRSWKSSERMHTWGMTTSQVSIETCPKPSFNACSTSGELPWLNHKVRSLRMSCKFAPAIFISAPAAQYDKLSPYQVYHRSVSCISSNGWLVNDTQHKCYGTYFWLFLCAFCVPVSQGKH